MLLSRIAALLIVFLSANVFAESKEANAEKVFRKAVSATGDEYLKFEANLLARNDSSAVLKHHLTSTNLLERALARNLLAIKTGVAPESLQALEAFRQTEDHYRPTILGVPGGDTICRTLKKEVGFKAAEFLALRLVKRTLRETGVIQYIDESRDPIASELLNFLNSNPLHVVAKLSTNSVRLKEAFRATLHVENRSKTNQVIRVYDCSWHAHWQPSNREISYSLPDCDKNSIKKVILQPGDAYTNELLCEVTDLQEFWQARFRMGFTPIGSTNVIWSEPISMNLNWR